MKSWRELDHDAFVPLMMILALSLVATLVSGDRIARMYLLTVDFVVEQSYRVCEQPLNNRCVTHYSIRLSDRSTQDFVPFGTELGGDFYEGEHIVKDSVGFRYMVGSLPERWPFLWQQTFIFLLGVGGLVLWYMLRGPGYLRLWIDPELH